MALEIRAKRKEKEKQRIQRLKDKGLYLTKDQREKYHRAQVQLEAAGILVPTRHVAQLKISNNNDQSTKKRILYDDHHRKKSIKIVFSNLFLDNLNCFLVSNISTELVTTAVVSEEEVPVEVRFYLLRKCFFVYIFLIRKKILQRIVGNKFF